jgi:IstB-like ATP binding protein
LDKALFPQLLTGKWIRDKRNLMIHCLTGDATHRREEPAPVVSAKPGWHAPWHKPPVGMASRFSAGACRDCSMSWNWPMALLSDVYITCQAVDGRFPRIFKNLPKTGLLILDDWGPDRLSASQRRDLMEIAEDRYGAGSILITSQLPIGTWHDVIAEPTCADTILDRLVHNACRLKLDGQSMRKTKTKTIDETPVN